MFVCYQWMYAFFLYISSVLKPKKNLSHMQSLLFFCFKMLCCFIYIHLYIFLLSLKLSPTLPCRTTNKFSWLALARKNKTFLLIFFYKGGWGRGCLIIIFFAFVSLFFVLKTYLYVCYLLIIKFLLFKKNLFFILFFCFCLTFTTKNIINHSKIIVWKP